jgi:death on curing protein
MTEIVFLTRDEVVAIHQDQIERYGGSLGIRDEALLESAVAMPRASFGGQRLHETIPAIAAAYLFHLVQNHAFIDGNKRVGAASAVVFLKMNGYESTADETEFQEMVLAVAAGRLDKTAATEFLERNVRQGG